MTRIYLVAVILVLQLLKMCSSSHFYIGCFVDRPDRDLPKDPFQKQFMTVEECVKHCGDKNFPFAGLQWYRQCFCGSEYGSYGQAPEADCKTACSGNSMQKCGGGWRNSVYSTSAYLGCFKDSHKRDLKGAPIRLPTMTPQTCIDHCAKIGFGYAGVQYHDQCFCGISFGKEGGHAPEGDCNAMCKGDHSQKCGGGWRNSIYATGEKQLS